MSRRSAHPAFWVPTAYLAEGIPFAMVMWVTTTMFKDLGRSDTQITGGHVQHRDRLVAQAALGCVPRHVPDEEVLRPRDGAPHGRRLLGGIALALNVCPAISPSSSACSGSSRSASATQDICVDGVYITTLDKQKQAAYTGVQGMAWNVGRIFATAAIVSSSLAC